MTISRLGRRALWLGALLSASAVAAQADSLALLADISSLRSFIAARGPEFGLAGAEDGSVTSARYEPETRTWRPEKLREEPLERLAHFTAHMPQGAEADRYLAQALWLYVGCNGVRDGQFESGLFEKDATGGPRLSAAGKRLLIDVLTAQDGLMLRESADLQERLDRFYDPAQAVSPRRPAAVKAMAQRVGQALDGREQLGLESLGEAGLAGDGAVIGFLDSGVDTTHPDFQGRIQSYFDFTGAGPDDTLGHGTHVAGIAAGDGTASAGRYGGVAPKSRIAAFKIAADADDFSDSPQAQRNLEDRMLAAMKLAASLPADKRPQVLNVSMGGGTALPVLDPVNQMANRLMIRDNILVVASAGNHGPEPDTIESPGSAEYVLTVSGLDPQGGFPDFTGRGPVREEFLSHFVFMKPDLATLAGTEATGVISARSAQASLFNDPLPDAPYYQRLHGTSQAAPFASGAAAAVIGRLIQQGIPYRATEVKALLMETAQDAQWSPDIQGAGTLDSKRLAATLANRVSAGVPVGNIACMLSLRLSEQLRRALAEQDRYRVTPLGIVDMQAAHLVNTDKELRVMAKKLPVVSLRLPPSLTPP